MTGQPQQLRPPARRGGQQGFTLVEVLIVVVVLGILSGLAVFGATRMRGDARASACRADAATVALAANVYEAATGAYPTSVDQLVQGRYLKTAPAEGTYSFDAAAKTATRTPDCSRSDDEDNYVTGLNGKCLDLGDAVPGGSIVVLQPCDGRVTQRWTAPPSWPGTVMALGRCLDVEADGTENRTNVQLRACDGSESQQWDLEPATTRVRNVPSGRCLDVANNDPDPGAYLILWDCHDGWNQQWTFI